MKLKCKCGYLIETDGMTEEQVIEAFEHARTCPENEKTVAATPELKEKLIENIRAIARLDKQIEEARKILGEDL